MKLIKFCFQKAMKIDVNDWQSFAIGREISYEPFSKNDIRKEAFKACFRKDKIYTICVSKKQVGKTFVLFQK
jgi:hypothetical protein